MSLTKFMLTFIFSIGTLSACSPTQDTAQKPIQTEVSELDPDTQKNMQTDLSEKMQNDKEVLINNRIVTFQKL